MFQRALAAVGAAVSGVAGGGVMGDEAVETVSDVEAADSIHLDEATGRRYSCNEATGDTQWLDEDGSDAATNEEENERKQQETRKMFRKFVNDDDNVYYENMETGEVVWDMPEDGELGEC